MSEVSMYKNNRDTKGENLRTVAQIYDYIGRGDWEKYTSPLRSLDYGSKEYKAQKNKFPAFTLSGVFPEYQRNDESVVSFTGKIAIDLDGLSDNVYDVKESLKEDDFVEAVFLSAGGNGLVVVIKINPNEFLESFLAIEKYFKANYGLEVDSSCKNISRLRYVTSDPDIFVNWESKTFLVEKPSELFLPQEYKSPEPAYPTKVWSPEDEVEKRCVGMILSATDGNIHAGVMKAAALAGGYIAGMNMDALRLENSMFNAVMQRSPNPQSESWERKQIKDGINAGRLKPTTELLVRESTSVFEGKSEKAKEALKSVYANAASINKSGRRYTSLDISTEADLYDNIEGVTIKEIADIYKYVSKKEAKYFGWDDKSTIAKVEIYIGDKWDLRYNVVRNAVDCKLKNSKDFTELKIENLYRQLQTVRLKYNMSDLKYLLNSDYVEQYDPFKHYFANLGSWDGKDYIKELASHIKVKDHEFFESMFKKHLVRAVRCSLGEGVNRFVFTIAGEKQSTGKTYFMRWLCPFENDYYTEASVNSKDKDTKIALAKNFIYNIDELASLNKNDIDSLKSLISIDKINERLPYAASSTTLIRRSSFFASTNNTDFLVDIENTRWLVFEVQEILRGYSSTMNVHDIWKQAYALYLDSSFNDQLTKEESQTQQKSNNLFEYSSNEEEAIAKVFGLCEKSEGIFFSTFDIINELTLRFPVQKFNANSVSRTLKKLGFKRDRKRINGNQIRGYYVKISNGKYEEDVCLINQKEIFVNEENKPF